MKTIKVNVFIWYKLPFMSVTEPFKCFVNLGYLFVKSFIIFPANDARNNCNSCCGRLKLNIISKDDNFCCNLLWLVVKPTCIVISSGFRRMNGLTKSNISTVLPLNDFDSTFAAFDNFLPWML